MTRPPQRRPEPDELALRALLDAIASHHRQEVSRLLEISPTLAAQALKFGATRAESSPFFFKQINHYLYSFFIYIHIVFS